MRHPLNRKRLIGRKIDESNVSASPSRFRALRLGVLLAAVAALAVAIVTQPSWQYWLAFDVPAVGRWWLTIAMLGLIVGPATREFTKHFPDGGVAINRALGLVAVTYVAWLFGSL